MKMVFRLIMPMLLALSVALPGSAFIVSQEEQWASDVREAKARAKDFEQHLERMRRLKKERESASAEARVARQAQNRELEKLRIEFVKIRNARPSNEAQIVRLEREEEKRLEAENRQREKERLAFIAQRNRVQALLEREAYIDPALEYDVRTPEPVSNTDQGQVPKQLPGIGPGSRN